MNEQFLSDFPHLRFRKCWSLNMDIMYFMGKCEELVKVMSESPILPEHYQKLKEVSLKKGAQATTAIEGNTLSDLEIDNIFKGIAIAPSKEYQAREVMNILNAFNFLVEDVIISNKTYLITPDLIKYYHTLIGKDLGEDFQASPGHFARTNRVVGNYKCPDHNIIEELIKEFCDWLKAEFRYPGKNDFINTFLQAVVTHIYFEWIHPFDDGNGRTGRLLEFFILLRGGVPDIATHILSNYYNDTRNEYYRQISKAKENRDLTEFIKYALKGFYEGLEITLSTLFISQKKVVWQKYIFDKFSVFSGAKKIKERRRALLMNVELDTKFTSHQILDLHPKITKEFVNVQLQTIQRDLKELVNEGLLMKIQDDIYKANDRLLSGYLPQKKEK